MKKKIISLNVSQASVKVEKKLADMHVCIKS